MHACMHACMRASRQAGKQAGRVQDARVYHAGLHVENLLSHAGCRELHAFEEVASALVVRRGFYMQDDAR